ncbi:DUF3892 domain-containing protein [Vibrio diabolicus]|uniref:DUF3892 domain-containing protein n=1 Tax=Vibrio diabolicus TaxID=50719 RepID=UPI003748EA26
MNKWADYLISSVRYNSEHSHITHLFAMKDMGASTSQGTSYTRQEVVDKIAQGITFETAYKNSEGNYQRGQKVSVIKVNGISYLKTVDNGKEEDNLENLPEF